MDSKSEILTYTDFKSWSVTRYGDAVFRIPVDLGVSCPHRTPTGQGGCVFCPQAGARAVQTTQQTDPLSQLRTGIEFARTRYKAKTFALYLQNYTPSAQATASFKQQLTPLLEAEKFQALFVGTRPDTLSDSLLSYLSEVNQDLDVFLELGVQSTCDEVLKAMNRRHTWAESANALRRIHQSRLRSVVHLILGWPGQSRAQSRLDVLRLSRCPVFGVKFHNLHVLKNSTLAQQFQEAPFALTEPYDYGEQLMELLRHTPNDWVVMRLMTDSSAEACLAPNWPISKGEFLAHIDRHMKWRGWRQGDLVRRPPEPVKDNRPDMVGIPTKDGTCTAWNDEFKEHYHAPQGALSEARDKFVNPANFEVIGQDGAGVRVLDVCFGLGYNTWAAWEKCREQHLPLTVVALEVDRKRLMAAAAFLPEELQQMATSLCRSGRYTCDRLSVRMYWGDARHLVASLKPYSFDRIFLDPFSTQRNSELWTVEFFTALGRVLCRTGRILTYSTAGPVLAGLREAGFVSGPSQPGERYTGTVAAKSTEAIEHVWYEEEWEQRVSGSRAIPYRDPTCWMSNSRILKERELVVKQFKHDSGILLENHKEHTDGN